MTTNDDVLPPPAGLGWSDGPDLDPAKLICRACLNRPRDMEEYRKMGRETSMSPEGFVWMYEGTLDRSTGEFLCTPCYDATIAQAKALAPSFSRRAQRRRMWRS